MNPMRELWAIGWVSVCLACLGPTALHARDAQTTGQPPALPELTIMLQPGGLGPEGNPAWIDLTTTVKGMEFAAGAPFLRIPAQFAGVPGVAYSVNDVTVQDEQGTVAISTSVDDPDEGGFIFFRRFTTLRDTQGTVTVSYRAPIQMTVPKLGAGPPFDLRAQGGGFSGAGNTFILMPDTSQPFMIGIDWQLDALQAGSIGVSSFGQGNTRSPGPVDRIVASYFMAGPIGHYPPDTADAKFSGYWIGEPRFDAADLLQWSQQAYGFISAYFEDEDPPAYRVLMRGNPYPGGGGAALMSSFLVSYPDTQEDGHKLRETIAHETVHNWVASIGGPPGSSSWYSEGMTVALTRRILLRSGLFSPEEFLGSVNDSALSYYTNALNTTPNDEIAAGFWRDTRIRSLPYSRGSLYFADVDAKVRKNSSGRRSLDDLARAFNERRRAGEEVSGDTWRELVTAELGDAGPRDLDAMLAGTLIIPPSEAFGPCFAREEKPVRRFELGFNRESLFDEPRVVSGLVAGSEAGQAGIREGDTILQPVPLEEAQSDPEKTLKLQLSRDGKTFEIEYLPRGETVTTYLWQRVAGVPDSACAPNPKTTAEPLLPQGPPMPARFEAVLQPQVGDSGAVTAIAVDSIIYGGLNEGTERLVLKAPVVYFGAYGIADRMSRIEVSDNLGIVELQTRDDEPSPGGFGQFRYWAAQRPVSFPVRIRYQTAVEPPTDRRGPPFNIKVTAEGVSGAGSAFLLLPQDVNSEFSRVRWDLREFRSFASGISSWGAGEFELAGGPDALMNGWFMAGPMGRYPEVGDERGFSAAWLGEYSFDPEAEMQWVGEAYHWLADYFGYMSPPPRFRVFMRIIASRLTHFSGTMLNQSFMLSGGPNSGESTNGAAPRGTFIHEMIHMWVGQIEGPQGISSWFSEGLTSYYSLVLPLRAGYEVVDDHLRGINQLAENYFTSPGIALSAQAIADVGFTNEYIRRTPYYRGAMYFADLDAQIRRKSHDQRNLDMVMREIFERRHNDPGFTFDQDAWKAMLTAELGPQAVAAFDRHIIDGLPMEPDSDSFGPCFERQPASYTSGEAGELEKAVSGYHWVRKPGKEDASCFAK